MTEVPTEIKADRVRACDRMLIILSGIALAAIGLGGISLAGGTQEKLSGAYFFAWGVVLVICLATASIIRAIAAHAEFVVKNQKSANPSHTDQEPRQSRELPPTLT
jgi:hypothetical protein